MGSPAKSREVKERMRQALEAVYGIEGVLGARVWDCEGTIAVGVRPSSHASTSQILQRVERAIKPLREPGETWEVGLLEED